MDTVTAITSSQRDFAKSKLRDFINKNLGPAQNEINRVMNEVPNDQIVRSGAIEFEDRDAVGYKAAGGEWRNLHVNAVEQAATRAGMPTAYAKGLSTGTKWERNLLAHSLNEHFHEGDSDKRILLRTVGDETRGMLSDRFRRLDCRPVLDTLIDEAKRAGALVCKASGSVIKTSVKIIIPEILEPVPGEFIVWGLSWGNSDYGKGANELGAFIHRCVCWNGMMAEKAMRQIHLGKRLTDDISFSEKTYQLDTDASVSAMRDVARHYLSKEKVTGYLDAIRTVNEEEIDGKAMFTELKRRTTKGNAEAVKDAFNSPDVVNLPPGNTKWRWANAVSFVAGNTENPETQIDLEKIAGDLLDLN